ncbi:uncharacterized protein [Ptychodera flava]|uniref:uncharacterized protein n=1 Tax=Ptychodera flava TaxID=63121 RepID=UPI00396A85B4
MVFKCTQWVQIASFCYRVLRKKYQRLWRMRRTKLKILLLMCICWLTIKAELDGGDVCSEDFCARPDLCAYVFTFGKGENGVCPAVSNAIQSVNDIEDDIDLLYERFRESNRAIDLVKQGQDNILSLIYQQNEVIGELESRVDMNDGGTGGYLDSLMDQIETIKENLTDLYARSVSVQQIIREDREAHNTQLQVLERKISQLEAKNTFFEGELTRLASLIAADQENGKWRTDLRCGSSFPLADGTPAECNPDSDYPCCSSIGWCGNTRDHCSCGNCIDYRTTGQENRKWRDDLRCGSSFPLADGTPAECNPDGEYPCCSSIGWCGNTWDHCSCGNCIDYRTAGHENGKWRTDLRCGSTFPLADGTPAECNPDGEYPCCSSIGWCGNTRDHCSCDNCIDYRIAGQENGKWRADLRCGSSFPLADGTPAECNPGSEYPCCSSIGWCGNTWDHCSCDNCKDYRKSNQKWRDDFRCGSAFPLANGSPAECDPNGEYPCCSPYDWCGNTGDHCSCASCVDYRTRK